MERILELLGAAGPTLTGVAIGGAVLALFWKGDDAISEQARKAMSNWLQRLEGPNMQLSWPESFIAVFDHIFGEKHLSWRCFRMSCVASFIAILIISATDQIVILPARGYVISIYDVSMNTALLVVLGGAFNFLPDYLSLLETRLILDRVRLATSRLVVVLWLVIDAVATPLIFLVVAGVPIYFFQAYMTDWSLDPIAFWSDVPRLVGRMVQFYTVLSVYFYTTFFTSFWIWIYVAARALVRGTAVSGRALQFLQWALPIRSKPVRSIGEVAAMGCCVGYWIFAFLAGAD